jgi:hypothetical protein
MHVGGHAVDREIVFVALACVLDGPMLCAGSWWPLRAITTGAPDHDERRYVRQLWVPILPAALVLAALSGWAVMEPEHAEIVPWPLLVAGAAFGLIWLRAAVRALRALRTSRDAPAATFGLLRPRAFISPILATVVDSHAVAAALAHEAAHVRHRDPLRIWLAQFVTDLQWPSPVAPRRFRAWLCALELARDDEARVNGVDGADLAAAIVAAARLSAVARPMAALIGDEATLRLRIERLLCAAPPSDAVANTHAIAALRVAALALALAAAVSAGTYWGEVVVRTLLQVAI